MFRKRLEAIIRPRVRGMTTVQTASLLENVSAYFDQAAALTTHPKGLLDQIKTCNSIYLVQFPFRREHGYEVIKRWTSSASTSERFHEVVTGE